MKYLYDVLDTDTGERVVESGTAVDVESAIGIEKRRIAMYVKTGNKFHRRYLIESVGIINTTREAQLWCNRFAHEWDKEREKVMGGLRDAVR